MLKPRAILIAFISMVVIGSVVFYFSLPEKKETDPRFTVRFVQERIEWHAGNDVMTVQFVTNDVTEGYHAETLQRKILLVAESGERLTLWFYIRILHNFNTESFLYEIVEYQFLLRYHDGTYTEYVNAVLLGNEEGDAVFEDSVILGKINFKMIISRAIGTNNEYYRLPVTTAMFFFSPEPEQLWVGRRMWDYAWNDEHEQVPLLVSFSEDGNASVPQHFTMEMFPYDSR
jgi:hypothetical protein